MPNNREKGARHERAVAAYLQAQGWRVERGFYRFCFVRGRVRPIVKDLFGAFDLVAVRHNEVLFIQVTAGGDVAARRDKAFAAWPQAEVWEHRRGDVYRIHRRGAQGQATEVLSVDRVVKQEETPPCPI